MKQSVISLMIRQALNHPLTDEVFATYLVNGARMEGTEVEMTLISGRIVVLRS